LFVVVFVGCVVLFLKMLLLLLVVVMIWEHSEIVMYASACVLEKVGCTHAHVGSGGGRGGGVERGWDWVKRGGTNPC